MSSAASEKDASGRGLLVSWGNDQDGWIREIVAAVLQTNSEPSGEILDGVYADMLVEKSLAAGEQREAPVLVERGNGEAQESPLSLVTIDSVRNVNILASEQSITFNPKMTVLFGRNGSGKTGYARILKRLSSVRREQSILPDITAPTPTKEPPEARIEYKLGDTRTSLSWKGAAGVPPFTRVDVFDAQDAATYVDGELQYVYAPSDVALFRHVASGIETIREKLESAKRERAPGPNTFVSHFKRTVQFYSTLDALGATTEMSQIRELARVTVEEAASLEGLRTTVEALTGQAVRAQLQTAQADLDLCTQALALADTLVSFDVSAHDAAIAAFHLANEKQLAAARDTFTADALPGFMTAEWQAFVNAGEQYVSAQGMKQYPNAGDHCVYCRQVLGEAAIVLLKKYREFCSGEHEKATAKAKNTLDDIRQPLTTLDLRPVVERLRAHENAKAEGQGAPAHTVDVSLLLRTAQAARDQLAKNDIVRNAFVAPEVEVAIARISRAKDELAERVQALIGKANERESALTEATAKKDALEARITLRGLLPSIETFVDKSRWVSLADSVLKRLKTTSKTLTDTSKIASERLINQDFEKHFREECRRLNAPRVSLDFKGQKGAAARKKQLRPEYRLTESLSEGEQKVIALADLLAEATLRTTNAPVVFDDPVTSLDYERIQEVAARLAVLANERQVIVFTHNIWFAVELLERFRDRREDCAYYDVRAHEGRRGVVSGGTHPRSDKESDLRKRVNTCITEGRKVSGETQDALVFKGYSVLRALCEVAVEMVLFQEVVRRYEPNVRLTNLPKVKPVALKAAGEAIYSIYEQTCRYIEAHSQPLEHLNIVRTVAELENDLKIVLEAIEAYKKAAA